MSARQSKKGVSAFTTWKSTRPIGVLTLTDLINMVELMPNWTFMAPVCIVLMSVFLAKGTVFSQVINCLFINVVMSKVFKDSVRLFG